MIHLLPSRRRRSSCCAAGLLARGSGLFPHLPGAQRQWLRSSEGLRHSQLHGRLRLEVPPGPPDSLFSGGSTPPPPSQGKVYGNSHHMQRGRKMINDIPMASREQASQYDRRLGTRRTAQVMAEDKIAGEPMVRFVNVQKSYDGETLVVKDLN